MVENIISDAIILNLQKQYYKGAAANTFEPLAKSERRNLEGGIALINEVCFSEKYPNSFADIYYCGSEKAPTLVYLHGGGWFMGSRTDGDPLASAGGGIAKQNIMMAKKGFNIISMDYCLAPEYRFPAQLHQINEGLGYFKKNEKEYGINMQDIVLFGGSAGAVLTAQLGLVYSNSAYAKIVGVVPAVDAQTIRGLAVDGAPMNPALFDQGVQTMAKTWLGSNVLEGETAKLIHVSEWVTEDYPRIFLTAGNEGCFMEHTVELGNALRHVGAEVDEYYPDPEISKEGHGYMGGWENSAQAREGFERQLAFIRKVTQ